MRDNVIVQWLVSGISVVAFILLLKLGAGYMPDAGPIGAVKHVLTGI